MLNTRSFRLLLLISTTFLLACQANSIPPKGKTPCWMSDLSPGNNKHIYGAARTVSASKRSPMHFAKVNAVNNWLISEGLQTQEFSADLSEQDKIEIGNRTLFFVDEYQYRGSVYVLVSTSQNGTYRHSCSIPKCDINKCSPSFLCSENEEKVTLYGISAPTAHPNDVLKHMIENAQQLAASLNHAKVTGEVYSLDINSRYVQASTVQQKFNIKQLDNTLSAVKVKNMCHYNGTLVSQIEFDRASFGQNHPWMQSPNFQSLDGAVGYAKGNVATGRLSDLVNVAARRGLFELAKAKSIKVESDVELEINSGGFYSLVRKSQQSTESVVSAFMADIKMELNGKLQPEVYVWLLENKGKL